MKKELDFSDTVDEGQDILDLTKISHLDDCLPDPETILILLNRTDEAKKWHIKELLSTYNYLKKQVEEIDTQDKALNNKYYIKTELIRELNNVHKMIIDYSKEINPSDSKGNDFNNIVDVLTNKK